MTEPEHTHQPALTREDLVRGILGEDAEFTAAEIAETASVSVDTTRRLWRALGFPEYAESEVAFTRADADALGVLHGTVEARSEEHTSELQSLMRISYAVFCLKK